MSIEGRLRKHRNETSKRFITSGPQQEDFIRKCRERKMSWKNVARKMKEQFGINRNANAIQSRMRQLDYEKMGQKVTLDGLKIKLILFTLAEKTVYHYKKPQMRIRKI